MPLMVCPKCTRFHYVPGDCPAPRSTAVRKDAPNQNADGQGALNAAEAGTQAPHVDALKKAEANAAHFAPKKRGRPKLHANRKAYKAQKERERRAKLKISK